MTTRQYMLAALVAGTCYTAPAADDGAQLSALAGGATVVRSHDGYDIRTSGGTWHAVRALHGYDLVGPTSTVRLVRTDYGFDAAPARATGKRRGVEAAATERQIADNGRGHVRKSPAPRR